MNLKRLNQAVVIGANGTIHIQGVCRVKWKLNNDTGREDMFEVPGTLYVPGMKTSIPSPQHCFKELESTIQAPAWESTQKDSTTPHWDNRKFKRTIPMNPSTNAPITLSFEGSKPFQVLQAKCNAAHDPTLLLCQSRIASKVDPPSTIEYNMIYIIKDAVLTRNDLKILRDHDEQTLTMKNPKAELLQWYYRYGHALFEFIWLMDATDALP